MEETKNLLQELLEQAQMGVFTLSLLLKKRPNRRFLQLLIIQRRAYLRQAGMLCRALKQLGTSPKGLTLFARKRTAAALFLELWRDSSVSHMAEMLTLGSTMGVIHARRCARKFPEAEKALGEPAKAMEQEEKRRIRLWEACL